MLRLWPERRAVALLSDEVWLKAGDQWLRESVSQHDADAITAAAILLQRKTAASWPRDSLDLLLSDEMARSVALPWQDGLRTVAQQARYAEACLEDAGVEGSGWTRQHAYRRHGRAGIAFAVGTETLQRLLAVAAEQRCRLRSVLPVTAAAYWRQPFFNADESLTILNEAHRVSLLHFSRRGLLAIDVQPVFDARDVALRRLLRQAQLRLEKVALLHCWSPDERTAINAVIAECYPGVPQRAWQMEDLL